jgi:hypothetical protein
MLDGFIVLTDNMTTQSEGTLALALEDKFTLKGLGFNETNLPAKAGDHRYRSFICTSYKYYKIIMRGGSRITDYNTLALVSAKSSLIAVNNAASVNGEPEQRPQFIMEGGSIDHNKFAKKTEGGGIVFFVTDYLNFAASLYKTGGRVADNVRVLLNNGSQVEDCNKVIFYSGNREYDISLWDNGATPAL